MESPLSDEVLARIQLRQPYPVEPALYIKDDANVQILNWDGSPVKSAENDIVRYDDYDVLDRCIYIDKHDMKVVQIRTVTNASTGWNPYADTDTWVKMCTKQNVLSEYPEQEEIIQNTLRAGSYLLFQQDVFEGWHNNGQFRKPIEIRLRQARIAEFSSGKMRLDFS